MQLISRMTSVSWASVRSRWHWPVRDRSYFTAVPSRVATFCEITLHPPGGVVVASPFQLGKFGLDRSWPWMANAFRFFTLFA
jgi:hypothetical protein